MDSSNLLSRFEGIRDEKRPRANTATRIGEALIALLEYITSIDLPYLRRDIDDSAEGVVTFLQGLQLGDAGGAHGLGADGAARLLDVVFERVMKSAGARRGFTDGTGIYMDAQEGLVETDGLNVRGFMRVMELIVNRLQLMESDYSFTEGDTVERIDYEDEGQTLVLTMHKDHANDYTPFYPGDIIYGIVNDLLPRGAAVPDGHTATKNGSYYHTWMRVKSVSLAKNQLRVALYQGRRLAGRDDASGEAVYEAVVPGGTNFSPAGTPITTDAIAPMQAEYAAAAAAAGGATAIGYDTMLTVTRHGNVADGLEDADDPSTYSDAVLQSQQGRQQAWRLSTTDQRLSYLWRVDTPVVRDDNYALCLGILPDLANLPPTRNKAMPSLYVNTIFFDHQNRANFPQRTEKVDRGAWSATPAVAYSGPAATRTPDGTLEATVAQRLGWTGAAPVTMAEGQALAEPYHCGQLTRDAWLRHRLAADNDGWTDAELYSRLVGGEWKDDIALETSRAWHGGALWECTAEGTAEEPSLGAASWTPVSMPVVSLAFYDSADDPVPLLSLAVRPAHVDETVVPFLLMGQEDISSQVTAWRWQRESAYAALDEAWANSEKAAARTLHLTNADLPAGWDAGGGRVAFVCTAFFPYGDDTAYTINKITVA